MLVLQFFFTKDGTLLYQRGGAIAHTTHVITQTIEGRFSDTLYLGMVAYNQ